VGTKAFEDFPSHIWAAGFQDRIERLQPFLDFDVLDVPRHVRFLIHGST